MAGEIERALYAHLVGWEYLGTLIGDRCFPVVIPGDQSLPAVVYQRISGPRLLGHAGATGIAEARIQLTIVAEDYSEAKTIAAAVRDLFDGWRGVLGGVCEVFAGRVENEVDGYGVETEAYTARLDLWFLYRE